MVTPDRVVPCIPVKESQFYRRPGTTANTGWVRPGNPKGNCQIRCPHPGECKYQEVRSSLLGDGSGRGRRNR